MQAQTTRKKKKRRMRLPAGMGSVHLIGDSKQRRNPWRARVPSHVELDPVKGTAKQKYITIGYYATEIDAINALRIVTRPVHNSGHPGASYITEGTNIVEI